MAQVMSERELELQSMYTASEELVEEYERDNAECHAQLEALEAERETWRLSTAQVAEESSALRRSSCALDAQLLRLTEQNVVATKRVRECELANEDLERALRVRNEEAAQQEELLEEAITERATLEEMVESDQMERDSEVQALRDELRDLRDAVESTSAALALERDGTAELAEQVEDLEGQISELSIDLDESQEKQLELKQQVELLRSQSTQESKRKKNRRLSIDDIVFGLHLQQDNEEQPELPPTLAPPTTPDLVVFGLHPHAAVNNRASDADESTPQLELRRIFHSASPWTLGGVEYASAGALGGAIASDAAASALVERLRPGFAKQLLASIEGRDGADEAVDREQFVRTVCSTSAAEKKVEASEEALLDAQLDESCLAMEVVNAAVDALVARAAHGPETLRDAVRAATVGVMRSLAPFTRESERDAAATTRDLSPPHHLAVRGLGVDDWQRGLRELADDAAELAEVVESFEIAFSTVRKLDLDLTAPGGPSPRPGPVLVDLLVALANEAVRTRFIGTSSSPPPHFERSTLRVSSKEEVLFERARRREGEVRVEAAEARAAAAERTADRMAARLAAWSRQ